MSVSMRGLIVPLLALSACSASEADQALVRGENVGFDILFEVTKSTIIAGSPSAPVLAATPQLVTIDGERVYLSDFLGHRVFVYNREGELYHVLGRRGSDAGEFQMPYGVAVDREGNIYVNDRGNSRVQVFDSAFSLRYIVATSGQQEQLFVTETEGHMELLLQGVDRCLAGDTCLFQRFDLHGQYLGGFGSVGTEFLLHTWHAARGPLGEIYVANLLGTQMERFTARGNPLSTIHLGSPTLTTPSRLASAGTGAEIARVRETLANDPHTRIRSIIVVSPYVFVQWERLNWADEDHNFVLDIFDMSGKLHFFSIATPGVLRSFGDDLYIINVDRAGHGTVTILEAKLQDLVRSTGSLPKRSPES